MSPAGIEPTLHEFQSRVRPLHYGLINNQGIGYPVKALEIQKDKEG